MSEKCCINCRLYDEKNNICVEDGSDVYNEEIEGCDHFDLYQLYILADTLGIFGDH